MELKHFKSTLRNWEDFPSLLFTLARSDSQITTSRVFLGTPYAWAFFYMRNMCLRVLAGY